MARPGVTLGVAGWGQACSELPLRHQQALTRSWLSLFSSHVLHRAAPELYLALRKWTDRLRTLRRRVPRARVMGAWYHRCANGSQKLCVHHAEPCFEGKPDSRSFRVEATLP